jgi:ABC-type transport system involved in multi-copper enzyme maturation permease subunit
VLRARKWEFAAYTVTTTAIAELGLILFHTQWLGIPFMAGCIVLTLAGILLFLGLIEFTLLPLLGTFRLGAISRITYYEALLQPFTIIIICAGFCFVGIAAELYYFTYNEDFKMYRDVASSFVFLFSLPVLVFASTKVVDEEIESRTILTLMSKPVARWQVLLGKYLGIILLLLVTVVALGAMVAVCGYLRYYDDMRLDYNIAFSNPPAQAKAVVAALDYENFKAVMALLPALVLSFLQLATLAAISVAVSTRWGLAVNVTIVILIYISANLVGFTQSGSDIASPFNFIVSGLASILPGLSQLDLNQRLVFGQYSLGSKDRLYGFGLPTYSDIWQYVALAGVYSLFYIAAALCFGMALFRSRELT